MGITDKILLKKLHEKDVIKINIKGISTTFHVSCFHFSQAYVEYAQLEQNFAVSVTAEQKNQPFLLEDGARSVVSVLTYLVEYSFKTVEIKRCWIHTVTQ